MIAFRTVSIVLCCCVCSAARAQPQASEPAINNLVHAPGTETCELGEIGVVKAGTGQTPLILIGGAPFGAEIWREFMDRNGERYTMHALVPAGYGGSNPPAMPEDVTRAETGEWTEAFLRGAGELIEREDLRGVVIVGHHFISDYYALRLAEMFPLRVRAVVLVAPQLQVIASAQGADRAARIGFVNGQRVPFFRVVTEEVWNQNSFPAEALSVDGARARKLFQTQVGVARPTQIRYFVEYLAGDEPELITRIGTPVTVIAGQSWAMSADAAIEGAVATAMSQGLEREQAMAMVMAQIEQQFGSREGLEEFLRDRPRAWELDGWGVDVRVIEIEDTGALVMLDRPAAFDEALREAIELEVGDG